MKHKPKVSIIVPVFHAKAYIDRCLESIVGQTYENIEILLMVKSGDVSLPQCIEWQKRDWRITIVCRNDSSLGDARNYAMSVAEGEYIGYIDADDWEENDFIEKMVTPLISNGKAEISCCGFDWNDNNGKTEHEWLPRFQGLVENGLWSSWVTVWIRLYRKSFLVDNDIDFFDGSHEDDAYYWLVKAYAKFGYFLPEVLYHYTEDNQDSLMHIKSQRIMYFGAMSYTMDKLLQSNVATPFYGFMLKELLRNIPYKLFDLGEERDKGEKAAGDFLRKYFCIAPIILFGSGNDANDFLIRHYDAKVKYIVDNNKNKIGKKLQGIEIKPYEQLNDETGLVVIASTKYSKEIEKQLLTDGYTFYLEMNDYDWVLCEYLKYCK